ncbi:hypothetical protein ACJJTC_018837 [Scirpophaga incertulas]
MANINCMSRKIICCTNIKDLFRLNNKFSTSVIQSIKDVKSETTIHKEELKKFSEMKKTWWELNGPMKALHSMNSIRVPFIRDGLVHCNIEKRSATPLQNMKILDVGCGGGILSEALSRIGADVTGIDANNDMITLAKLHSESNNKLITKPNYICTTIEDHAQNYKGYYDGIVASEVVEHIENKELFIKKCVSTLKVGGKLFFTTPNRTRLSQMLTIYAAENIIKLVPQGTHQYELFITPNELSFLLERNNCHVDAIYGTLYNIFTNKWQFISSPELCYALQAEKYKE